MKDNIVLIGIMGCGKSSLGKQLAKRLSMTFVDMDALIEKELDTIPNEKVRKIVMENLRAIAEDNRRDFRF